MYVFFRPAYNQLPLQDLHCQLPSWLPCLPPLKSSSLASPDENLHFTRNLTFLSTSFAFMGLSFFGPLKGPWARKDVFFCAAFPNLIFLFPCFCCAAHRYLRLFHCTWHSCSEENHNFFFVFMLSNVQFVIKQG